MVNKRYSLKIVNLYLFEILLVTFRGNISTKTKYIIKYSSIFKTSFLIKQFDNWSGLLRLILQNVPIWNSTRNLST